MPRIELSGLCKSFARPANGSVLVLDGLDLAIESDEVHALLGFSGCGKTTLLRLIAGLEVPDRGAVRFDGEPAPPRIGVVFQEPRLLPWASVADNLLLALRRAGLARDEREARVAAVLDLVGLGGCAALRPAALSGGMAQRAALARALVRQPALLLLDEPLGALDPLTRRQMQDELAGLRVHFPRTTVLVTHAVAEAVRLADRVSLLVHGRIAQSFVVRARPGDPPPRGAAAREMEELLLQALFSAAPRSDGQDRPTYRRATR
jgi:ABC-type nitrate/sulfonate/bicarbonate transport system ATPase subunit